MRAVVAILLVCTLLMMLPLWAQDASTEYSQQRAQEHPPGTPAPPTQAEAEMQKRLAKQRNQDRFAQLKKDTDQLLELAKQLKKYVDETSDQKLSLEVIHKAEQIEKLAKQVRQKMVGD